MVTAVDSSVLLDVLLNDLQHAPRSIAALRQAAAEGSLIICETTMAEIVPTLSATDLPQFLSDWSLAFVPSSQASAMLAGEMFRTTSRAAANAGESCPTFSLPLTRKLTATASSPVTAVTTATISRN